MNGIYVLADRLRWLNAKIAIVVGFVLIAMVAYTLVEIIVRRFGGSLGGVEEYSSYVMALLTAWGMSYALTERAHVRIDLIRQRLRPKGRAWLDFLALSMLTATSLVICWFGFGVLQKTISTGARANTALETPLWIPQLFWWSGWLWFAVSGGVLMIIVAAAIMRGELDQVERVAGMEGEI